MTGSVPFKPQQIARQVLVSLALAIATVIVYLPVRHHEFINLDDDVFVTENPNLRGGLTWRSVHWAFTAALIHNDRNADYWRPVSYLSHALDIEMFGLRPAGHHLMNVGIHAAAAVALFLVLQSMTGAPWRCAFVAALFALHPLRVESVAWVTERKDVLSGLLFLLTLGAYARYVRGPFSLTRYLTLLVAFALALMAKPMVVTLPVVLLLLDYWPLGRTQWAKPAAGHNVTATPSQLLKEKLPFFVLAAVSSGLTSWWQRKGGAMDFTSVPLGMRTANAVLSYVGYIGKTLWPTRLAVFYPLAKTLPAAAVVLAAVGLAGVTAAVIWAARRMPWLVTGWLWYLVMLVPVIGLVQGAGEAMADRFAYLPSVGLYMMLCWSVPYHTTERQTWKVTTCVSAGLALALCAVLSRIQVGYWKDSETLYRHSLDVTRDNWLAHFNLGNALEDAAKPEEAIRHYEQALEIRPEYVKAHSNLGGLLAQQGRIDEAISHLEKAVRLRPEFAVAHVNLGNVLLNQGRTERAQQELEEAVRLQPELPGAHIGLGNVLWQLGKGPEAIGQYEEALRLNPDLVEGHFNLGNALFDAGKFQDAAGQYQAVLLIKPGYAEAHYNLGNALLNAGRFQDAIKQYEETVRILPDHALAYNRLAIVLARVGRVGEAIPQFEQVVRLTPTDADAHYNLGNALAQAGRTNDAVGQYEEALHLNPNDADARNALARLQVSQ